MVEVEKQSIRVYKYRWVILVTFCLYCAISFCQNLQYTIIANITTKYYDVNPTLVDLTCLLFMVCFVLLCLPTNSLIEKYNLKVTAIISSGLTTCGNLIKLLSVSPDRFYLVVVGQFLCAVGQVFMLNVPSKLANTWFGPEEVSMACALALFGCPLGVAVGSMLSSILVKNSNDVDAIGHDFWVLMIINASITTMLFISVLIFFRAKPPLPPSQSQLDIIDTEKQSTLDILKSMLKNKNYLLLLLAVGNCKGVYTCLGIIINGVYLHYFPGYETEIGIISAMAIIAGGCIGSIIFGYILDKYHNFKTTAFFVIFAASISYIFIVLSFEMGSQLATYFTLPMFGFFMVSTLLVGFEFATEVMYPTSEVATLGVLNSVIYIFGVIYTFIFEGFIDNLGYMPTHALIFSLLILSAVIVSFVTPNLRRREANIKK